MAVNGDIELARYRIYRAEIIVLRQRKLLLDAARRGGPVTMAEELLETYEQILTDYRARLQRLVDRDPSDPF